MDQYTKQNLQKAVVEALYEKKTEMQEDQANNIIEKLDKRIVIPLISRKWSWTKWRWEEKENILREENKERYYKELFRKAPIKNFLLGLLSLLVFCSLWLLLVGLPVIYFSSKQLTN